MNEPSATRREPSGGCVPRTCRFPGCDQRRSLPAHHVEHWARGGRTKLANLVQLCRHHHRLVHEGVHTLERGPAEALIFRRRDGRPIPSVTSAVPGHSVELVHDSRGRGAWITPDTCRSRWDGSRLDLALSVDGLAQAALVAPPRKALAEPADSAIARTSTVPQCTCGMRAAQPSAVSRSGTSRR
jgi:HNH endonuclease